MLLDGLSKKRRLNNKIYRSASRINFLIEQKKPETHLVAANRTATSKQPDKSWQKEAVSITNRQSLPEELRETSKESLQQLERPPLKKIALIKIVFAIILIFLISGTMYLSELVFSSQGVLEDLNKFNPLKQLARLVTSSDKRVAGELADRVNILAMGMGGAGHEGPYLTDTIMVISIKPSTGEVGLISLPRDMIVELGPNEWVKINQVYSMGKLKNEWEAAEFTTKVIEKTLALPIHYYGIISFKGFEEFIDNIGGIMVNVERSFVDNQYPTDDYKTTTVSFEAGLQLMDGSTALIFARSRHGTNGEGSDFARSRRQQLILQAVKEKIFKFSTLLSPTKVSSLLKLIENDVETNLSIWQAIKIARMVEQTSEDKIYRFVLDDSPESFLEPGFTQEGAWILQPKDGNFQAIQRMVNNIFNIGPIKEEAAKIEIQNGTETPGLAYWTKIRLEQLGYQIVNYGNAATTDYQKTVIYDLSNGQKKKTLKWLKEELAAYVVNDVPAYLADQSATNQNNNEAVNQPDLVVILGLNHAALFKLPQEKPVPTATSTAGWATSTLNINVATTTMAATTTEETLEE